MTHDDGFSAEQVAELTGLSATLLRAWEDRYGWPCPPRRANGYRVFSQALVDELRRVAAILAADPTKSPRDIIVDRSPQFPPLRQAPDFTRLDALRDPPSDVGRRLFRMIRGAVRTRASVFLLGLLDEARTHVHPRERVDAAWLPVLHGITAWDAVGRPLERAEASRALIQRELGAEAFAELLARVIPTTDHGT